MQTLLPLWLPPTKYVSDTNVTKKINPLAVYVRRRQRFALQFTYPSTVLPSAAVHRVSSACFSAVMINETVVLKNDYVWNYPATSVQISRLPVAGLISSRSGSRQNNIVIFIIRCQHPVRLPFVLKLFRSSFVAPSTMCVLPAAFQ